MTGLPQGWEWDYDGSRWFYRYKPTGIIQYTFPKPGDEFPEFIDTSAGAFDLAPEDWLASEQQVKQRSTQDGTQSHVKGTGSQRKKKAVEDHDEMSATGYFDPESFMYLGPGAYTDVSPDVDAQESVQPEDQVEEKLEPQISSVKVHPSIASPSSHLDVVQTTGTPIMGEPATATQQSRSSNPPVPVLHQQAEPVELSAQQPWSPVGFLSELASHDTIRCADEMRPIELDSMSAMSPQSTLEKNVPVELPADDCSEPRKHLDATSSADSTVCTLVPTQSVESHPYVSASFAYGPFKNDASTSSADHPTTARDPGLHDHGVPAPQANKYKPWTPGQSSPQRQFGEAKRESVVLSTISVLQSQNVDLGLVENKRHSLSGPPPCFGHNNVVRHPTVLTPSLSPKARLGRPREGPESSQGSSQPTLQLVPTQVNALKPSDNAKRLPLAQSAGVPGTRARHDSISTNSAPMAESDLNHFPSVLRPANWRRYTHQVAEESIKRSEQLQTRNSISPSHIPDNSSLPHGETFDCSQGTPTRTAINLDQDIRTQHTSMSMLNQEQATPLEHDKPLTTAAEVMESGVLSSPQSPHPLSRPAPGFVVFHEVPPTPTGGPAPASLPAEIRPTPITGTPAHPHTEFTIRDEASTAPPPASEQTHDISGSTRSERLHFTDSAPFAIVIEPLCSETGQIGGISAEGSKQQYQATALRTPDEKTSNRQTPGYQPEEPTHVVTDELISDIADLSVSTSTAGIKSNEGWTQTSTADFVSCIPTDVAASQSSNFSEDRLQDFQPPEQQTSFIPQSLPISTSQVSSPTNSFVSLQHTPSISSISIPGSSHMSHGSIQGSPNQGQIMPAQRHPHVYPPMSPANAGPGSPQSIPIQQMVYHQPTWPAKFAPPYIQQPVFTPQSIVSQQQSQMQAAQSTPLSMIGNSQTQAQFQNHGHSSAARSGVGKGLKKLAKKAWKNPAVKQATASIAGAVVADSLGINPAAGASRANKIYTSSQSAKPGAAAGRPPGPTHTQTAPPQAQSLDPSNSYATAQWLQPARPASVQVPGRPVVVQNIASSSGHPLYMHQQPPGAETSQNAQWTAPGQVNATVSLDLDSAHTPQSATTPSYDNGTVMLVQANYADNQQYTTAPVYGDTSVVMTDTTYINTTTVVGEDPATTAEPTGSVVATDTTCSDTITVNDHEASTIIDVDVSETTAIEDMASPYCMGEVVTSENEWVASTVDYSGGDWGDEW